MLKTLDTAKFNRLRRLRINKNMRDIVSETQLDVNDFIYPLFVTIGNKIKHPITSMPNIYQLSIDELLKECYQIINLGIKSVILFGIPNKKDDLGKGAYNDNGIVQKAVKNIKKEFPNLIVITDVCLCEYTSHGHCGIIKNNQLLNDDSIKLIAKTALSHAQAGADIVAPSDMFDGRIKFIRNILDENGFEYTPIMSYSAKYASSFYGPFRDAAQSAPSFGDRKSHQLDFRNSNEAIREIEQDIIEGADIIMVKPALSYLDIIKRARDSFNIPIAAYNVSGEYSMIKAACSNGWMEEKNIVIEILTSIKRAGADLIITYFAKDAANILQSQK